MSRDPLEELFGPLDSDDAETGAIETDEIQAAGDTNSSAPTQAFEPAPAVRRSPAASPEAPTAPFAPAAAPAPAPAPMRTPAPAPARAAREEPPTRPVSANPKRSNAALPWIIIAAVAVLALVGALIAVNALRNDDAPVEETTAAPVPTPTETDGAEPETPAPTPEEPEVEEAPKVDVGANPISMDISFAGISVESSQKLTNPQWFYHAGPPERVMIESGLMNSFPESCSAMRSPVGQSPWGIEKGEDDTWTVVRPEGTCTADPTLYDEVWGLMQAVADSAKPL